jgi:hypothetical protein
MKSGSALLRSVGYRTGYDLDARGRKGAPAELGLIFILPLGGCVSFFEMKC